MTLTVLFVSAYLAISVPALAAPSHFLSSTQDVADDLVKQLRELPTALPGVAPSALGDSDSIVNRPDWRGRSGSRSGLG